MLEKCIMPSEESMIEDLRELESELREKEQYRKANTIDLFIKYSTHCKVNKSKIKKQLDKIEEKNDDRTENIENILDEQHFYFNSKDYYEGELTGLQEVKIALIDLNRELLKENK